MLDPHGRAGMIQYLRIAGASATFLLPAVGISQIVSKQAPAEKAAVAQVAVKAELKAAKGEVKSDVQPAAKAVVNPKPATGKKPEAAKAIGAVDAAVRDPSPKREAETAKLGGNRNEPARAERDGGNPRERNAQEQEVVAEVFAAAPAVDVNQFEQQFRQQFKGLLKTELYFLNNSCKTTSEQKQELKTAADQVLTDVVKKFAELQKKMNQGGFDWNSPAPDPRRSIQEALLKVIKQQLSADQVAPYEMELVARLESRKRASVLNIVARLDDELILTQDQRTKMTEELIAKWKAAESQQLEIFLYGDNYFPNVPEQLITACLNEKQKEVWRGIPRSGNIFFGIGHIGNVIINEAIWADEPADIKEGGKKTAAPAEGAAHEDKIPDQAAAEAAAKAATAKDDAAKEAQAKDAEKKEAARKDVEQKNGEQKPVENPPKS